MRTGSLWEQAPRCTEKEKDTANFVLVVLIFLLYTRTLSEAIPFYIYYTMST